MWFYLFMTEQKFIPNYIFHAAWLVWRTIREFISSTKQKPDTALGAKISEYGSVRGIRASVPEQLCENS